PSWARSLLRLFGLDQTIVFAARRFPSDLYFVRVRAYNPAFSSQILFFILPDSFFTSKIAHFSGAFHIFRNFLNFF
ncbi:MAG: hypothetical protein J5958_07270, partial [Clostridia bacterium]|nr:hypothetical protein [Clostridia bacterium]